MSSSTSRSNMPQEGGTRACAVLDFDHSAIVANVGGPDSPATTMQEISRRKRRLKLLRTCTGAHLYTPRVCSWFRPKSPLDLPLCLERVQNSARSRGWAGRADKRTRSNHPEKWKSKIQPCFTKKIWLRCSFARSGPVTARPMSVKFTA